MRVRAILVPLAVAAALLAGCTKDAGSGPAPTPTPTASGLESLTGAEIMSKAVDAIGKAESYRLKGKALSDGKTIEIDIVVVGDTAKGTISFDGASAEVIQMKDASYIKSDTLWAMALAEQGGDKATTDAAVKLLNGKWVKVPAAEMDSILPKPSELFDPAQFGAVAKGEKSTIDGKPVIAVEDRSGGKIFIALTGEPYPVRVDGGDLGSFDILEIGTAAAITAPPASEVLDLATLGG